MVRVGSAPKVDTEPPVAMSTALRLKVADAGMMPRAVEPVWAMTETARLPLTLPAANVRFALPSVLVAVPPVGVSTVGGVSVAAIVRVLLT